MPKLRLWVYNIWRTRVTPSWWRLCIWSIILMFLSSCGGSSSNGTYSIAFDSGWYGVALYGQQINVTGFSRDLLQEIGQIQHMRLSMVSVSPDTLMPNLKNKKYDAILSSLHPYLFNTPYFDFSGLYLSTGPVLVMPVAHPIGTLQALAGKEIATFPGSPGALLLENYPDILIRPYSSMPEGFTAIVNGTIDGAIADVLIASAYCNNLYSGAIIITTPPLNEEGLRLVALRQRVSPLLQRFNDGLAEMKRNGQYQMLLEKWSLGQGSASHLSTVSAILDHTD